MKQDIKEISYNLTKTQEDRLKRENAKNLLKQLKKDMKYIFFRICDSYKIADKQFYEILKYKNDIIEKIFLNIRDLEIEWEEKKETSYGSGKYNIIIKKQARYGCYDDMFLYDLIEESFYKLYSEYKKQKSEYRKQYKDSKEKELNKKYDKLKQDLYEYYDTLNNRNYNSMAIEKGIIDLKADILRDCDLEVNRQNDMQFYKILRELKRNIPTKYIPIKQDIHKKQNKVPMGWKAYFGLVAIDKALKHLK